MIKNCPTCGQWFNSTKFCNKVYCSIPCHKHRLMSTKRAQAHFWAKVDKNGAGGCWNWTGGKDKWGYGDLRWKTKHVQSHRLAWRWLRGEPGKMDVLHKCHNPSCCNPKHLYLGTDLDNSRDRLEAGRYARGERCPRRKLSEAQAIEILAMKGKTTGAALATKYGVYPGTIHAIWRGSAWSHLPRYIDTAKP